jgi:hypothetical protein
MTHAPANAYKKLHIQETVLFALKHIPQLDEPTLTALLELVNATGSFGSLSRAELLNKMHLTLKYVPSACPHSLLVLADLLDIPAVETQLPQLPSPAYAEDWAIPTQSQVANLPRGV